MFTISFHVDLFWILKSLFCLENYIDVFYSKILALQASFISFLKLNFACNYGISIMRVSPLGIVET